MLMYLIPRGKAALVQPQFTSLVFREDMMKKQTDFKTRFHRQLLVGASALMLASVPVMADMAGGALVQFDIAAQPLSRALLKFSDQSKVIVVVDPATVKGLSAPAVNGTLQPEAALDMMLEGTGLSYEKGPNGGITIVHGMGVGAVEASADEKASEGQSFTLEEIIVTAQKRAQSAQDVPISISAFSSTAIEQRGINNVSDLQDFVPGLHFGKTDSGQALVSMRGIATNPFGIGFDPGVAIHIDGHYLQSTAYMTRDLYDISRIEVLRGPQGTLYGKNVVGGTINVITNKPSDEAEGRLDVEIGSYNQRKIKGVLNMPISDVLKGRVSMVSEDRDGFTKNLTSDQDLDASDYTSFRGALLYTPTDNLEILLSGYDYRNSGTPEAFHLIYGYPAAATLGNFLGERIPNPWLQDGVGTNPTATDRRKVKTSMVHERDDQAQGISLDIDWALGDYSLKSLSSYNDSSTFVQKDASNSDIVLLAVPFKSRYETFSQELQLGYDAGETYKWIAGLYYYTEETQFDFGVGSSYDLFDVGLPSRLDLYEKVKTVSLGAFAQLDHRVTDNLELTYGIRYSRDEKDYFSGLGAGVWDGDTNWAFLDFENTAVPQSDAWSKVTGRLAANYTINDDVMIFASLATGYKSGGFTAAGPFKPETVIAYEAGMKSQFADRRVQVNLTAFYNDYQDKQESQVKDNRTFVTNAATAEIYGLEAEVLARPTPALELTAMVAYMHARFGEFADVQDVTRNVVEDLSGNVIPRAPEWKVNLAAAYTWELGDYGNLIAWASFSWSDDLYFRAFNIPQDRQPAFHTTDARLTWESVEGDWTVSAFVNNIEDNDILEGFSEFSESYGSLLNAHLQPPRTYGLSVGYRF